MAGGVTATMIATKLPEGHYFMQPGERELAALRLIDQGYPRAAAMLKAGLSSRAANPKKRRKGKRLGPPGVPSPEVKEGDLSPLLVSHFFDPSGKVKIKKKVVAHRWQGYVLWEGPSLADGKPIAVIATGFQDQSDNEKTGKMIQTFIIRSDMDPQDALDTGEDESVCFGCDMKGKVVEALKKEVEKQPWRPETRKKERVCYVAVGRSVKQVYKAYKEGKYGRLSRGQIAKVFKGAPPLRIGAYGEPVAAPEWVWREALENVQRWTGYTHQWRDPRFASYKDILMASVNSPDEAVYAKLVLGWNTYRAANSDELPLQGFEVLCPWYDEGGPVAAISCDACGWCGDLMGKVKSVVAPAHGSGAGAFQRWARQDEGFRIPRAGPAGLAAPAGTTETPEGTLFPRGYFEDFAVPRQRRYADALPRRAAMRMAFDKRRERQIRKLHEGRRENPGRGDARIRSEGRSGSNLLSRMRAGEVSQEQVELAARLGRADALELFPEAVKAADWWAYSVNPADSIIGEAVRLVGIDAVVLFALDCAEYALPNWEKPGGKGRLSGPKRRRGNQVRERIALAPRRVIQAARRLILNGADFPTHLMDDLARASEESTGPGGTNSEWLSVKAVESAAMAASAALQRRVLTAPASPTIALNRRMVRVAEVARVTRGYRRSDYDEDWQSELLAGYVLGEVQSPRQNPCNTHPTSTPVTRTKVYEILDGLRKRAGLKGTTLLQWHQPLTELHERNHRRYAQVYFPGGDRFAGNGVARYEVAEQIRWLPARQLRAVLGHEVGHELAPTAGEAGADQAAERALGMKITYDPRWPGKGLQRANPSRMNDAAHALALARQHGLRASYVERASQLYDLGLAALEGHGLGALQDYAQVPGVKEKVAEGKFIASIGEIVTAIRIKHENVSQLGSAPRSCGRSWPWSVTPTSGTPPASVAPGSRTPGSGSELTAEPPTHTR
jgi:hypothetical protein